MISRRALFSAGATVLTTAGLVAAAAAGAPSRGAASGAGTPAGAVGAPHIHAMPVIADARIPATSPADCVLPVVVGVTCVGNGTPMTYAGGVIQTAPAVYIVQWGWNGSDPSGEGPYQQSFFNGVGGSAWNGSQTQYCNSTTDPFGTTCASGAGHVGNQTGLLKGVWADNTNAVPSSPDDAAIQAEAVRAASHFANSSPNAQYIIDTPHGNSTSGFGTQWCAYHGQTSGSAAVSYTDFPYIPDAGGSCGQNFVNPGSAGTLDGVSIVGGHEFAESETDVNPPSAWTDTTGAETGDKCAWIQAGPGAVTNVAFSTGNYAVQSLWSNAANGGTGACVTQ